jgi:hypothetical protein
MAMGAWKQKNARDQLRDAHRFEHHQRHGSGKREQVLDTSRSSRNDGDRCTD